MDAARAAGLRVEAEIAVPPAALPRPVDAAAYRIVQESVTNVLRHAHAATVRIRARIEGDELALRIHDDGAGTPSAEPGRPAGAGLRGMRERAELLGGTLAAGPGPDGFTVTARLPLTAEEQP
jgi:signal transduction histidine kinase